MKHEVSMNDEKVVEQNNSKIILQLVVICHIAYLNYILFSDKNFLGIFNNSILLNPIIIAIIMLILLFLLARHLIGIKIILYRIFLQTFLSQSSRIYKFLSHGFLVRLVGLVFSAALVINVLIFMSLASVHKAQYIGLSIGFVIFWIFRKKYSLRSGITSVRSDLNMILKSYLMPFILATATGLCIAAYEIWNINELHHISSFSEALEISLASIDPTNDFFWKPIRIMARHIYAWEILVQQLAMNMNIQPFGKIFYFVFLIISQGSITFFAIFLMAMPYKREVNNENG